MVAASLTLWTLAALGHLGAAPLAGTLDLDLYRFFSVASVLGWLAGNVYVLRRRMLPARRFVRRLLSCYVLGPPSLLFLLRALADRELQAEAPLVPFYALVIYGIFFLVPVTLRHSGEPPAAA